MKNQNNILQATKSWKNINTHYLEVLKDPWYRLICDLENLISKYTYQFYFGKDMKTIHLPITTSTISSPMGLGSDSSPVKINLFNIPTYLADSMQFMLEYGCRLYIKGVFILCLLLEENWLTKGTYVSSTIVKQKLLVRWKMQLIW